MASSTCDSWISSQQIAQYHEEGYMILPRVLPVEMLEMLREECSYFLGYCDGQMDWQQKTTEGLTHRGKRYFVSNRYRLSARLHQFIFSELMAQVVQATLGPQAYLFHEQWVVKGAEQGMKFAWHQDSGYVKSGDPQTTHKPYLTCWCPLDDVNEENGTVYILPHSKAGTKGKIFDHIKEEGTNDLVGYHGDDPGLPVIVPAGSIVAFSSFTFHRSGANTTSKMRRVYLPQYSSVPITFPNGKISALAVPFLKDGQNIYDRSTDTADKYGPLPR